MAGEKSGLFCVSVQPLAAFRRLSAGNAVFNPELPLSAQKQWNRNAGFF
jgi:hypothetical protein